MKMFMESMDTGSKRAQLTEMKTNSHLSKWMQGHTFMLKEVNQLLKANW